MKAAGALAALGFLICLVFCRRAEFADLVLKNGAILPGDFRLPTAQAVAVAGNTIIAVGTDREIGEYVKPGATEVIDLGGRMVVPGFNDAHIHFLSAGESLDLLDLTGITDYQQMKEKLAARVKLSSPGEWISGRGWDQTLIPGNAWPTKEILDEAAPDNPVSLSRVDGHSVLVNSLVLKKFSIGRDTPDPPGGAIVRDPATGEPTGVLKEKATALVRPPELSPQEERESKRRHLRLALDQAKKCGLTSIHHLTGDGEYFEELQSSGELTVRVYLCQPLTDDPQTLEKYKSLREKYRDNPLIKFGSLKGYIDGTLGSQTAALFEPYSDGTSTTGLLTMPVERLEELILRADRDSFQVAVHAIGTRANRIALEAYEKAARTNGRRDSRHRIEHAQILTGDDLPRFAALGMIASMQPTHCITDKRFAEKRLGRDRCRYAYAWNSILKAGGRIAFGTDCPVEPMNPLDGIFAAVTRKDKNVVEAGDGWFPEQKLTVGQAVELYTLGPAYASFEEHLKGTIQPGKLADLVVLSKNLLEIPEYEILTTQVVYTIFDGRIIYSQADESSSAR